MKKVIGIVVLCVMLAMILTACSGDKPAEPLNIGTLPDVDSIPLIIAQEMGYFQEEGVTVNIQRFNGAPDRESALQAGELDGAVSDMLAAVFNNDGGFEVKITSLTNGTYKMLVHPDTGISSVAEIAGSSIAISFNTIIEYCTDMMLEKAGLTPDDVEKVAIPQIPTRLEMLQNGQIDAATLPDPLATVAVSNGAVLLNSSDQMGINPGVLLFTADALENKEVEIEAMYRAYNRAVEYVNSEPVESYVDILIDKAGFPAGIKDSIVLPRYTEAGLPAESDFTGVMDWLTSKELIDNSYTYDDLVVRQFVE